MSKQIQAVRGMNDILPDEANWWTFFEDKAREVLSQYGYRYIRTPIVEPTGLFVRSIGEVTDIVEKEMYTFVDSLNGDSLTLRPEGTAGIVRAVVEHNLLYNGPQRVWTYGPMFRHERPQKGRYRQFHQFDAEALGYAGPDVDAELIVMLARLWRVLGLNGVRLDINTIGDALERKAHREALIEYFEGHADLLDEDAKRRLHTNPLRILDTKNPRMQDMVDAAPKLIDMLGSESRAHFDDLQTRLHDAGLEFSINPRLVRGMDYYNRTVFEWVSDGLGDNPLTIAGGGRYDGLIEQLGGKPAPAIGFGIGVERVILLLQAQVADKPLIRPDVYLVHQVPGAEAMVFRLAETMRDAGLAVVMHAGEGSFKSQMKKADGSGARYAVILGEDEAAAGTVSVKPLLQKGEQATLSPAQAILRIKAGD